MLFRDCWRKGRLAMTFVHILRVQLPLITLILKPIATANGTVRLSKLRSLLLPAPAIPMACLWQATRTIDHGLSRGDHVVVISTYSQWEHHFGRAVLVEVPGSDGELDLLTMCRQVARLSKAFAHRSLSLFSGS